MKYIFTTATHACLNFLHDAHCCSHGERVSCSYRYRLANVAGVGFDMVSVSLLVTNESTSFTTNVKFPASTAFTKAEQFVAAIHQNVSKILYGSYIFQTYYDIVYTNLTITYVDAYTPPTIGSPQYAPSPSYNIVPASSPQFNDSVKVCQIQQYWIGEQYKILTELLPFSSFLTD